MNNKYIIPQEKARESTKLDGFIGSKVRSRRMSLGMSQEKLAESIGVTFQQVQKYEKGINRISASTLFKISRTLQVEVQFFFEGYQCVEGTHLSEDNALVYENDNAKETRNILKAYYKISSPSIRKKALDIMKSLQVTNNAS